MTDTDKKRLKPHLQNMARFCARQERAVSDVLLRLKDCQLSEPDIDSIVRYLQKEGFLDETRYACCFARDKFRLNQWGKEKIAYGLRGKGIAEEAIEGALGEIDTHQYESLLKTLAAKKAMHLAEESPALRKNKLARFLIQRGFEGQLVREVVNELIDSHID